MDSGWTEQDETPVVAPKFDQFYRAYPASFMGQGHIDNGDKIIMPASALDRLMDLQIDYPMLFSIQNNKNTMRVSHCGVLEFTAEEGFIFMPSWMMDNLLLEEHDLVKLKTATLPKGNFVKLQPHTSDFLDISNPKAMLETALKNFTCLTAGDTIVVPHNNKKYHINIIDTKPSNAIRIIDTDVEVEFAPPLDYKEPERVPPVIPTTGSSSQTTNRRAQGKVVFGSNVSCCPGAQKETKKEASGKEDSPKNEVPKFQAFQGKSYSLLP